MMLECANVTAPLVQILRGCPVTTSLAIARAFGRRHDNVLQKIDSLVHDRSLDLLDFKAIEYVDDRSRRQPMFQLTERAALIAMPFIGGKRSREGQRVLVDAFIALRDRQTPEWKSSRKLAAVGYTIMSDTLMMTREDLGKTTSAHHYSNEAKLVNSLMFASSTNVNRDELDARTLRVLERLEIRNSALIAQGKAYQDRKVQLTEYLTLLQSKHGVTHAAKSDAAQIVEQPNAKYAIAMASDPAAKTSNAGVQV